MHYKTNLHPCLNLISNIVRKDIRTVVRLLYASPGATLGQGPHLALAV